jgi:uncharacterized protein (TIGR02266 family)
MVIKKMREKTSQKGKNGKDPVQKDRRRVFRSPMIVLQVKIEQGRKTFFGYAKNISCGGMFITSVNPPKIGSRFRVTFDLPDGKHTKVQCTCEVIWNRSYARGSHAEPGMGLRFLDLPEEPSAAIDAWVQSENPKLSDG